MITLKRLVVSPYKFTRFQELEQLLVSAAMAIPGLMNVTTEFLVIKNFLKDAKIDKEDKDMDRDWIQQKVNRPEFHHIHVIFTQKDWKKLRLRKSLWGSSGLNGGQVITYGRWEENASYQASHRYPGPFDRYPEASIGTYHEANHGFRRYFAAILRKMGMSVPRHIANSSGGTHTYLYGYERFFTDAEEKKLRPERWVREPQFLEVWRTLPWPLLHEIKS